MRVRTDFAFTSHAPAGSEFILIPGTYESNICDYCGNRRKCDLFEHAYTTAHGTGNVVFMDLCRSCRKAHTTEVGI